VLLEVTHLEVAAVVLLVQEQAVDQQEVLVAQAPA
tara:strand:+ start:220 stop:324 length:105 start_codon:yes stop_codon:yes gene_type:complete